MDYLHGRRERGGWEATAPPQLIWGGGVAPPPNFVMLIFFQMNQKKRFITLKKSISIMVKRFIILFSIHDQIKIVRVTKLTSSNNISGCKLCSM